MRRFTFILFWALALVVQARAAAAPTQAFEEANRAYEQKDYTAAARLYSEIIAAGHASPPLFYNLGNASFRMGETGRAIANYRRALQLAPRDSQIRVNLEFARDSIASQPSASLEWLNAIRPREAALLATVFIWLAFGLMTMKQLRPDRAPPNGLIPLSLCLAGLMIALTFWLHHEQGQRRAVVAQEEAVVRFGPLSESETAFSLRDGAEVDLIDQKDAWRKIRDASGRAGWVLQSALEEI